MLPVVVACCQYMFLLCLVTYCCYWCTLSVLLVTFISVLSFHPYFVGNHNFISTESNNLGAFPGTSEWSSFTTWSGLKPFPFVLLAFLLTVFSLFALHHNGNFQELSYSWVIFAKAWNWSSVAESVVFNLRKINILTPRRTSKVTPPLWYRWGVGGVWWNPPYVFAMLQYLEKISPLVESLWCALQDEVHNMGYHTAGGLRRHPRWPLSWAPSWILPKIKAKKR